MEVMDPFEFAFAVTDGVEGCVHMLEEDGSFSCELDSAGVSVEESGSEAFFKFADGFADGRLADVEFFGGAGDVAATGYFVEDFVL